MYIARPRANGAAGGAAGSAFEIGLVVVDQQEDDPMSLALRAAERERENYNCPGSGCAVAELLQAAPRRQAKRARDARRPYALAMLDSLGVCQAEGELLFKARPCLLVLNCALPAVKPSYLAALRARPAHCWPQRAARAHGLTLLRARSTSTGETVFSALPGCLEIRHAHRTDLRS
jgi:hypothetical protein